MFQKPVSAASYVTGSLEAAKGHACEPPTLIQFAGPNDGARTTFPGASLQPGRPVVRHARPRGRRLEDTVPASGVESPRVFGDEKRIVQAGPGRSTGLPAGDGADPAGPQGGGAVDRGTPNHLERLTNGSCTSKNDETTKAGVGTRGTVMTRMPGEPGMPRTQASEKGAAVSTSAPVSDLTGWRSRPFTGSGETHTCFEKGAGPGVIVVPEVPGITPEVLGLADHLVDCGFTVVVPSLFGVPARKMSGGYVTGVIARLCVSTEFRAFATNAHRPVADFLRALARDLAGRTPGPGVGIIGMCFTGGFALAAAVDDAVLAPVMSQPSVPFPLGPRRRADPGVSDHELDQVLTRTTDSDLCVLGLRFSRDRIVPTERFDTLRRKLGAAFEVIELDSSRGNPAGFSSNAHSVLTHEVRDEPGHPALAARERVVAFMRQRLAPAG